MKKYDKITAKQLFYAHLRTSCAGAKISGLAVRNGKWPYYIICSRRVSACGVKHRFSLHCKEKTYAINILAPLYGACAAGTYKNRSAVFMKILYHKLKRSAFAGAFAPISIAQQWICLCHNNFY